MSVIASVCVLTRVAQNHNRQKCRGLYINAACTDLLAYSWAQTKKLGHLDLVYWVYKSSCYAVLRDEHHTMGCCCSKCTLIILTQHVFKIRLSYSCHNMHHWLLFFLHNFCISSSIMTILTNRHISVFRGSVCSVS